ncbi:MAG: hypothetical protein R3343_00840 [Nitriliruptorales bacterium]|nr:hypothetical protein [Nitriliruptorales bacterium]
MSRRLVLGAAGLLGVSVLAFGAILLLRDGSDAPPRRPPSDEPATETFGEQLERVAAVVESIRGLEFEQVPEPTIVPPDELAERIGQELQAYTPEDAAEDERILVALGVLTPDDDLRALIIRGYSEQVAGYYDPETRELVVGVEDVSARLGRIEELVLAHELQHALADAVLGLPELDGDAVGEEDAVLARQALTEGDATLTMQHYVEEGFSVVDQLLLPTELADLAEQLAGFTELPHYVQRSFTFPYEEGTVFVSELVARGGWTAVNDAYSAPPTTTAEILFPDRYPGGETLPVAPPAGPGEGWQLLRDAEFGAADLLFLFEAPGNDPDLALEDPLAGAAAWRGGRLHLYTSDDTSAVGIALATDDAATLCTSVGAWYDAAHSDDRETSTGEDLRRWEGGRWSATLSCEADSVRLGIGPTVAIAGALVGGEG